MAHDKKSRIKSRGWAQTIRTPRTCSICHETYNRRNLTEIWDTRNFGHRAGWNKTILKLCMRCFTIDQALRVTSVIATTSTNTSKKAEAELNRLRTEIERLQSLQPPIKEE